MLLSSTLIYRSSQETQTCLCPTHRKPRPRRRRSPCSSCPGRASRSRPRYRLFRTSIPSRTDWYQIRPKRKGGEVNTARQGSTGSRLDPSHHFRQAKTRCIHTLNQPHYYSQVFAVITRDANGNCARESVVDNLMLILHFIYPPMCTSRCTYLGGVVKGVLVGAVFTADGRGHSRNRDHVGQHPVLLVIVVAADVFRFLGFLRFFGFLALLGLPQLKQVWIQVRSRKRFWGWCS